MRLSLSDCPAVHLSAAGRGEIEFWSAPIQPKLIMLLRGNRRHPQMAPRPAAPSAERAVIQGLPKNPAHALAPKLRGADFGRDALTRRQRDRRTEEVVRIVAPFDHRQSLSVGTEAFGDAVCVAIDQEIRISAGKCE